MSETRRQYDPEFKAGAVRIVLETRRPVAEAARELGIGAGTLGNWVRRDRAERSGERLDAAVLACFDASRGAYGSPRVLAGLRRDGHKVSKKSVEASMARQGLSARLRPGRARPILV